MIVSAAIVLHTHGSEKSRPALLVLLVVRGAIVIAAILALMNFCLVNVAWGKLGMSTCGLVKTESAGACVKQ